MSPAELMKFFSAKQWMIDRLIKNSKQNTNYRFEGTASFERKSGIWNYSENGILIADGSKISAKRNYLYVPRLRSIDVQFPNGNLFFSIDCEKLPTLTFQHLCNADLYSGLLSIAKDGWRLDWKVQGPRKDLEIESSYS